MRYKFLVLIIFSLVSAQSLFNRFLGADSFSGSAKSTAMGMTHLLNSTNSHNVRFNPAMLSSQNDNFSVDFQVKRFSSFERWSMPMRDSFDEVLVTGDYVSNEFSKFLVSGGATMSLDIPFLGNIGVGYYYFPLTHFTYSYSEEVRGQYSTDDGEYASKDPNVGFHNFNVHGTVFTQSVGVGTTLNLLGDYKISIGGAINSTQPFTINESIIIDTLYSDVKNLAIYPNIDNSFDLKFDKFISVSAQIELTASSIVAVSYESKYKLKTNNYYIPINPIDGLFQYWNDKGLYLPAGLNYLKPEIFRFSWGINSTGAKPLSVKFEINKLSYYEYLNFDDIYRYKFGFEYLTQLNTPVRGGLIYSTSPINMIPSKTIFTFGSGKKIGEIQIDFSGTYQLFTFQYPDLFSVEYDVRPNYYDTIRESQLNLFLAVIYSF